MTELIGMIPVPDEVSPEEVQRWRPSLLEAIAVGQAEGRHQAVREIRAEVRKVGLTGEVRHILDRVAGLNATSDASTPKPKQRTWTHKEWLKRQGEETE